MTNAALACLVRDAKSYPHWSSLGLTADRVGSGKKELINIVGGEESDLRVSDDQSWEDGKGFGTGDIAGEELALRLSSRGQVCFCSRGGVG